MERITYRITLDTHRTGIQRTLQGFETADKMARRITINLVESGDSFEMPMANVAAMMYVTTPNASEPSINDCVIDGNTIIYDVEPIVEEGITEMQLKLIDSSTNGANGVLISPRFAVEVAESGTDDEKAEQSTTFTALENAIAKADAVYNSRVVGIEIGEDCSFIVHYADGTTYENDALNKALYNGNALLSESFARGGTGTREGEDTDNAMYYAGVSKTASASVNGAADEAKQTLDEIRLHSTYTIFNMDFEKGNLVYISSKYDFDINKDTGNLEVDTEGKYTPEQVVAEAVEELVKLIVTDDGEGNVTLRTASGKTLVI